MKTPCFDTPPPLTVWTPPVRKEPPIQKELADAIREKSMAMMTLALNRQALQTGSLIHACVDGGYEGALQFVLEHGLADRINQPSSLTGECPLEWAMRACNSKKMIEILLDFGADPNTACTGGQSLLHKAAATMNLPAVKLLLGYGADPRQVDDKSCTPLHVLCKAAGYPGLLPPPPVYHEVAAVLRASGVDPARHDAAGFLAEDYIPSSQDSQALRLHDSLASLAGGGVANSTAEERHLAQ